MTLVGPFQPKYSVKHHVKERPWRDSHKWAVSKHSCKVPSKETRVRIPDVRRAKEQQLGGQGKATYPGAQRAEASGRGQAPEGHEGVDIS